MKYHLTMAILGALISTVAMASHDAPTHTGDVSSSPLEANPKHPDSTSKPHFGHHSSRDHIKDGDGSDTVSLTPGMTDHYDQMGPMHHDKND